MRSKTCESVVMERLGGRDLDKRIVEAGFRGKQGREDFARLIGIKRRTLEGWVTVAGTVPAGKLEIVEDALSGRLKLADPLERLNDLSDLGLVAHMQQVVALLAARLDDRADSNQIDGASSGNGDDEHILSDNSEGGTTDGRLGMPPKQS